MTGLLRRCASRNDDYFYFVSLLFPPFARHSPKFLEPPRGYGVANAAHQLLVISKIDAGEQNRAQHFVRFDQMMQIGAGIRARGRVHALGIDRSAVLAVPRIGQVERTEASERHAVPAVP